MIRLDTSYPDPRGPGGPKGGPVGFCSLSCAFWWKLYKTKVAGHPQLSGGRSPYRTLNLEGPVSRGVYNIKVVVHGHRDRALAWRGLQGPGRPMSGYPNIFFGIKSNLETQYSF